MIPGMPRDLKWSQCWYLKVSGLKLEVKLLER